MSPPSLVDLCLKQLKKHIDELDYAGQFPYWKARTFLKWVRTPQQLAVIEEASPQIAGDDAELWEAFCKKDFPVPMRRDPRQPENPQAWRQVYEYYADVEAKKEAAALAQLDNTFRGLNQMKTANQTTIGDPRNLPKAPSSGAFGRSRGKGPGPGSATLTFGGGARTTNAVQKARKEAQEVAARKRLSVPRTMRQTANLVRVTKAPESMRAEARIRAQPKFIPPGSEAAVKRRNEEDDERGQMEARLLAAKRTKVVPKTMTDEELRSGSSKSVDGTSISESRQSITPKKPRSLFSRPQSASIPQNKVTIKTVGKPTQNAAPEKTGVALKPKAGLLGSTAAPISSLSAGRSASPPAQRSSRPGNSRIGAVARQRNDLSPVSRVSSPGLVDRKPSRIAPPKRLSRSPSVASSVFGSPEPEVPGPSGRRSSFRSNSSRSSSPLVPPPARPEERANTPPAVASPHEAKSGSPPKRKADETPNAVDGRAAAHPPAKKKKVDIFMRRKR